METLVAVPTAEPGGMDASVDAHFGHCGMYTLVAIADGAVKEVTTVPSCPHEQGGCMAPVQYLADHKVKALISGGMGMRPLMGFNQVGIQVFHGNGAPTVKTAIEAFLHDSLPVFTAEQTCGGGR
ncbi:dinitrogenase iron-molybdenum cofactor biosynthesis protein [Pseudodesulfovibrio sp. JC047]|uniref:NifB/NifX family molybdenum-iron cluster-binding protein n=1 Tax=Pseudodesulfovibrio sp. JC047 TaxID=2683199 RepID=UPI0013D0FD22|nr:NifB/NifX family molybdenum-iron cluster-binding protein [Pseudodesulfovibrio sp. JC047]NDV19931.1 dinitrogenase iron-molybdenum cofactor biosynthesis protein [Pseudodesulfovibrio sp. JC047]